MRVNWYAPEWFSRHLHFDGELYGEDADRVLLSVVDPFIRVAREEKLLANWFFIRYGESGTHIRLRILSSPANTRRLDAALNSIVNGHGTRASGDVSVTITVIAQEYIPELERYGGRYAMRLSEEVFCRCSEAALEQVRKLHSSDQTARLAKALLSQLVLLHVFTSNRSTASTMARIYSTNYVRSIATTSRSAIGESFESGFQRQEAFLSDVVHDVWNRLDHGEALLPELDVLRERLRELASRLYALCAAGKVTYRGRPVVSGETCLETIVPSYIHMMNNRVGVSVIEEAFLAHLAARTLS